jgi:hypothetical protein
MNVDDWMARRVPPVPEGFRPWIAGALAAVPRGEAELTREARSALARAAKGSGERNGAFDLLVADALATWAAEAVLEEDEAEGRLEELVRSLAR